MADEQEGAAPKYDPQIGAKRGGSVVVGAIVGNICAPYISHALAVLQTIGLNVVIDHAKFDPWFTGIVSLAFFGAHDFLRLKFPDIKWL